MSQLSLALKSLNELYQLRLQDLQCRTVAVNEIRSVHLSH